MSLTVGALVFANVAHVLALVVLILANGALVLGTLTIASQDRALPGAQGQDL